MFFKRAIGLTAFALLGLAALASSSPANANLIANGNLTPSPIPTGSFVDPASIASWSVYGSVGSSTQGQGFWDNGYPGCSGPTCTVASLQNGATLSQTVAGIVAGNSYTLFFGYDGRIANSQTAELEVILGSTVLADITGITPVDNGSFSTSFTVDAVTFTATTNEAAGGLTFEEVAGAQDATVLLDSVILNQNTPINSVPEPGSMALLGAGLLGLLMVGRRSRI